MVNNQKSPEVKAFGNLIKTEVIFPEKDTITNFFKEFDEKDLLSDILFEWQALDNDIIIFPIEKFQSQINLMKKDIPFIYHFGDNAFLFLKEIRSIGIQDLKNIEELSGAGAILTPFELKFENYSKKYLRDNSDTFFDLPKNGIIINNVRLTINKEPKLKLTGRAAELAREKGLM
jgi:hypothetical protein